jgi:hypothetical protein
MLQRHNDRKTSCEPIQGDLNVPPGLNGCRFCYKRLKTKSSLTRHYKTCKIKNGGTNILFEKIEKMEKRMDKLCEENKQLKMANASAGQAIQNNNGHAAAIQGDHNTNTQVQFTLNSYKKPDMKDIKLSLQSLIEDGTILKTLMESIYFNPAKPENHSILSHNLKEKKIAVYNDTWKLLTSDKEREQLVDEVKAVCSIKGGTLLNADDGPYCGDITSPELALVIKNRIIAFNGMEKDEANMTEDEMLNTFHSNRKMVKDSMKQIKG